jgi:hypothetical protein
MEQFMELILRIDGLEARLERLETIRDMEDNGIEIVDTASDDDDESYPDTDLEYDDYNEN